MQKVKPTIRFLHILLAGPYLSVAFSWIYKYHLSAVIGLTAKEIFQ